MGVLIVNNLPDEFNCDRLFNLVCLYGNVSKIFFMKKKKGSAMVEMCDPEAVQRVVTNLNKAEIWSRKLLIDVSRKHTKITSAPLPFELPDGSTSVKDFLMAAASRLNRFSTAYVARKNRILPPTKVLHFFGISKCDEDEIEELFVGAEAPRPSKVKWVESKKEKEENSERGSSGESSGHGVGLAYFDTKEDAITALVLVNHKEFEGKPIKLCFSPATY